MEIRVLRGDDAEAFRALRLRALREHPEAFAMTPDEFSPIPLDVLARRLDGEPERPHDFTLGAFEGETLAGMLGFGRMGEIKQQHKGVLWGMYVMPEATGHGIGRGLVEAAIARCRKQQGLEALLLTVVTSNVRALGLYQSLGFRVYGTEPRALRLDGRYLDEALMMLHLT
jgi:ribosomal protein S18 acetylase RimI-like enzyme